MLHPLTASAQASSQPVPQPRLVRAAHEFEAQMMKELLKPLTAGDGLTGSDEESGSAGALGDFAGEALGQAVSQAGGFGVASCILADVSRSGNRSDVAPVIGDRRIDTVMKPGK